MPNVTIRDDIVAARRRHPSSGFVSPWDRRLTPDAVLSARSAKVAALLARTEGEAGR